MKSTQSLTYERLRRQRAKANDREQKEKRTTRARRRAENRPDNNRPAPPRARPQAKTPTQETTPRQETDNLEISVQLSRPFVLRTKSESEDPEAFSIFCNSKSLAEKVTFEILPMWQHFWHAPFARPVSTLPTWQATSLFKNCPFGSLLAPALLNPIFVPFSGTTF